MRERTAIVAAVLAALLVPVAAAPALAHGEHKVANYTFVVGFGPEPGPARPRPTGWVRPAILLAAGLGGRAPPAPAA